jgi:hypothetical protein
MVQLPRLDTKRMRFFHQLIKKVFKVCQQIIGPAIRRGDTGGQLLGEMFAIGQHLPGFDCFEKHFSRKGVQSLGELIHPVDDFGG